jgi:ferredoxin-NADP reductase
MPRYPSKLIDRFEVADGTLAFAFERPAGFEFTAGQFLTLTLPDPRYTDEKGNRRTFSISSPPQDAGRLLIATRMTGSALKRSLAEAPLGTHLSIFGPSGCFTLHEDPAAPAVFVAGGIGITPFRSILHDASSRQLPHPITLVYSNRTPEGAAFYGELIEIAGRLPSSCAMSSGT